MNCVFNVAGERPAGARVRVHNQIPLGKGLGSSAAAICASVYTAKPAAPPPLEPGRTSSPGGGNGRACGQCRTCFLRRLDHRHDL